MVADLLCIHNFSKFILQEMANRVLNQSESQGRDLAEQMSQRLKVTEAMLSEAVKDRERLVTENQSAVENLLATISSKDQLLKVLFVVLLLIDISFI